MSGWTRNETPWVDRTVRETWDRLEREAPKGAMPREDQVDFDPVARGSFEEYGCGLYGCVLPTSADNVVLKLTSDASEAGLAAFLLSSFV